MGFGEGRVLHLVSLLEEAPLQSLFVLEEPETSLHEEAQYRLIQYLIDVCERRGHQVIFTTHSSVMLEALPSSARKLLHRTKDGVTAYKGISSTRARALFSGGTKKELVVLVEDEFAHNLVREIVRAEDASLLKAITIQAIGSTDDVREGVKLLKKLERKVIGIRDGDIGTDKATGLYSLPGSHPPEIEVFENNEVMKSIDVTFGVDVKAVRATATDQNHHSISALLAKAAETDQTHLEITAIAEYVKYLDKDQKKELVSAIASQA